VKGFRKTMSDDGEAGKPGDDGQPGNDADDAAKGK
jgi:hypothetical protein